MFVHFMATDDTRISIRKDQVNFICEDEGIVRLSVIGEEASIPVKGTWEEVLAKLGIENGN